MAGMAIKTIDGKSASLSPEAIDALRGGLRGDLCLPGEAGYDEARTIWNAMIDKRPAAVVRAGGRERRHPDRPPGGASTGCCCRSAAAGTTSPGTPSATAG